MKYKAFIVFATVVCCLAFGVCMIIGAVNEWDDIPIFLLAGAVEFILIWIFAAIGNGYCPSCGEYGTMYTADQQFQGMKTIERKVDVPHYSQYKINGKTHSVHEWRRETEYQDVEVWKCLEKCSKCGYKRVVERTR